MDSATISGMSSTMSPLAMMLELIGESRLLPILGQGRETPEMIQRIAKMPGKLAQICQFSPVEGAILEEKILNFDLSLIQTTAINQPLAVMSTTASTSNNQTNVQATATNDQIAVPIVIQMTSNVPQR